MNGVWLVIVFEFEIEEGKQSEHIICSVGGAVDDSSFL